MLPDVSVNVDVRLGAPVQSLAHVSAACNAIASAEAAKLIKAGPTNPDPLLALLGRFADHLSVAIAERRELANCVLQLTAEVERLKAAK